MKLLSHLIKLAATATALSLIISATPVIMTGIAIVTPQVVGAGLLGSFFVGAMSGIG